MSLTRLSCTLNYSGTDKESTRSTEKQGSVLGEAQNAGRRKDDLELVEWVCIIVEAFLGKVSISQSRLRTQSNSLRKYVKCSVI